MQNNKYLKIYCGAFIVIFLIIILWYVGKGCKKDGPAEGSTTQESAEQAFENSIKGTLALYGDSIDHYYYSSGWLSIYIDKRRWIGSTEETKKEFIEEVSNLLKVDAVKSGILEETTIRLVYFTSDREEITRLQIIP